MTRAAVPTLVPGQAILRRCHRRRNQNINHVSRRVPDQADKKGKARTVLKPSDVDSEMNTVLKDMGISIGQGLSSKEFNGSLLR